MSCTEATEVEGALHAFLSPDKPEDGSFYVWIY